ncbi:FUSC family protein [Thermobrachium celere]|uniref:Integral membrane protein n=1 Tax=Thermobrachium celere DSM 8682 TaxID=941824 RepID=R7RTU8_9CLOT|nr:aromatic acid exporter family protein [Thermobrachium celere]CDF58836.1 Integral membrane protein [Thermobrachium celere DSM 8682]
MTIGMRNIKTALAVFLSIIFSNILKLDYPFYAAIASLVCMQSTLEKTYTAGKNRLLGTFIGAVLGFVFASLFPTNALFSALGIVLLIYICNKLDWNDAISMAGIVFLGIMLNIKDNKHALVYSYKRLLETLIGITIAFIVNSFIKPPEK